MSGRIRRGIGAPLGAHAVLLVGAVIALGGEQRSGATERPRSRMSASPTRPSTDLRERPVQGVVRVVSNEAIVAGPFLDGRALVLSPGLGSKFHCQLRPDGRSTFTITARRVEGPDRGLFEGLPMLEAAP